MSAYQQLDIFSQPSPDAPVDTEPEDDEDETPEPYDPETAPIPF